MGFTRLNYMSITVREVEEGTVSATVNRIDPGTRKLVHEHVADLMLLGTSPVQWAACLKLAADLWLTRVLAELEETAETPAGG